MGRAALCEVTKAKLEAGLENKDKAVKVKRTLLYVMTIHTYIHTHNLLFSLALSTRANDRSEHPDRRPSTPATGKLPSAST